MTYIYTDTNPITLPCSLARAGNKVELFMKLVIADDENKLATVMTVFTKREVHIAIIMAQLG